MVGHTSIVYSVDSHASGLIVSGSEDCSAKIWKGFPAFYLWNSLFTFYSEKCVMLLYISCLGCEVALFFSSSYFIYYFTDSTSRGAGLALLSFNNILEGVKLLEPISLAILLKGNCTPVILVLSVNVF